MSKFKVGDEVTVVRNVKNVQDLGFSYVGWTFIIKSTYQDGVFPCDTNSNIGAWAEDIELTAILDTPLYQALK